MMLRGMSKLNGPWKPERGSRKMIQNKETNDSASLIAIKPFVSALTQKTDCMIDFEDKQELDADGISSAPYTGNK